jgi:hypothetical protein
MARPLAETKEERKPRITRIGTDKKSFSIKNLSWDRILRLGIVLFFFNIHRGNPRLSAQSAVKNCARNKNVHC